MNTDSTVPVPIERSLVNYMFPSAIQEKLYQFNKSISKSKVFSYLCRCCSIATGCASILILWCELVMASSLQSPIGLIMGAYKTSSNHIDQRSVLVQAVSFVALAYMSICTYWALFKINIGWKFKLQGPQLSPTPSLIFNAEYFSRLQFAMGYNFLLCLNVPRYVPIADGMLSLIYFL